MEQNLEKEVECEEIDGYAHCSNSKQKCLQDCFFGSPFITTID